MKDFDSDLRTHVHTFLRSDPRSAWRLSATCKERRSVAGLCPPVLLLKVGTNTVVMLAKSQNTYYEVEFGGKAVSVGHEGCIFSACLYRYRMPNVTFSGRLNVQVLANPENWPFNNANFKFKYTFKDPLSQWTVIVYADGRTITHQTYPSGPRDNNDYFGIVTTTFVPDSLVSAYVASMSHFDLAM